MTTIDERKKSRWLMLRKFYELANGRADDEIIDMWEVGKQLGWDRETTEVTYDYLQGEGLLKAMTLGGGATITHQGVKEVEKAEEHPQEPTLHFPAFIVDIRMPPEKAEVKDGQAKEEEEQASGAPTYSVAHPSVKLPARFVGVKAEKIEQLIASGGYSKEEEEEVWGALIEMVKRFNSFKETQRKMRKEG